MSDAARGLAMALLLVAACGPGQATPWATVELGLGPVPAQVASLAGSVTDPRGQVVASATVAAPHTRVALGVPAEIPLEVLVVARTNRPSPEAGGTMPAYVGRTQREVPLGREPLVIALELVPAGLLTFQPSFGAEALADGVELRFSTAGRTTRPASVRFRRGDLPAAPVSLVLPAGPIHAEVVASRSEAPPELSGARGLYVAREQESLANLRLAVPREPSPGAPVALRLGLSRDGVLLGALDPVEISGRPVELELSIEALDDAGQVVAAPDLVVRLGQRTEPPGVLGLPLPAQVARLPARVGLLPMQAGRLELTARAAAPDGTPLSAARMLNVLGPGDRPGEVARLHLAVQDERRLPEGTGLVLALLDRRGFLTGGPAGRLELGSSDPWAFFPEGASIPVRPGAGPALVVPLVRSSGPRGLEVVVRATLTSTVGHLGTWTSTLTLPVVDLGDPEASPGG